MKKNQILAGMFLAGITLGACTDDFIRIGLTPNPILRRMLLPNMRLIMRRVLTLPL